MKRTQKRLRICTCLILVNLAFIWGNSLLPGQVSGAISDWVREIIAALLPFAKMGTSSGGVLRKLAHFSEFALLGALLSWLLGMLEKPRLYALAAGFLAACTDETIQRFVPDRGPSLRDVGIDTCGVITGILLLCLGYSVSKKKKTINPLEEMNQ